jgi:hypothetical protein
MRGLGGGESGRRVVKGAKNIEDRAGAIRFGELGETTVFPHPILNLVHSTCDEDFLNLTYRFLNSFCETRQCEPFFLPMSINTTPKKISLHLRRGPLGEFFLKLVKKLVFTRTRKITRKPIIKYYVYRRDDKSIVSCIGK